MMLLLLSLDAEDCINCLVMTNNSFDSLTNETTYGLTKIINIIR